MYEKEKLPLRAALLVRFTPIHRERLHSQQRRQDRSSSNSSRSVRVDGDRRHRSFRAATAQKCGAERMEVAKRGKRGADKRSGVGRQRGSVIDKYLVRRSQPEASLLKRRDLAMDIVKLHSLESMV